MIVLRAGNVTTFGILGVEGAKARGHKANFELRKLLLYGPRAELFFLEFSEKKVTTLKFVFSNTQLYFLMFKSI